mgnify:CR=1 FL=1
MSGHDGKSIFDKFLPDGSFDRFNISNSVPGVPAWPHFDKSSRVLRVHRSLPKPIVLRKKTFSGQYAIHDNDMI